VLNCAKELPEIGPGLSIAKLDLLLLEKVVEIEMWGVLHDQK